MLVFKGDFILLAISIIIIPCAANWIMDTFNFVTEPIRKFNHFLTNDSLSKEISDSMGDVILFATRPITDVSLAITRLVGDRIRLPRVFHHNIELDFEENFLQQFIMGTRQEDAYLDITKLARKYGYNIEEHTVYTSDGYILTAYRIPPKNNLTCAPPVLLMHGLLGSSDDWVVTGPGHSLAFQLSDRGYDVWLGNARGNVHSKRHLSLSPAEADFWDFSWHEIGIYDLPATVDYILDTAGRIDLKYIGWSQGTTAFFVMCSERPEYNEKIQIMVALSPVAWMSNAVSPVLRLLSVGEPFSESLLSNIGINEFLPNHSILKAVGHLMCAETSITQIVCSNVMFLIAGFDIGRTNATNLPIILSHAPAGASVKQVAHYCQGVLSGEFRQLDRGAHENLARYNNTTPPRYNVEGITASVALFYSDGDWLSNPIDVMMLRDKMPNVVDIYKVPGEHFNHLDFVWGVDVNEMIYRRLIQILEEF